MRIKWNKNYLYKGVTAFCVIALSIVFYMLLSRWGEIAGIFSKINGALSPVLIGICIAYLLAPVMNFLECAVFRKLGSKIFSKSENRAKILSRVLGIVSVIVILLIFTAGVILMVIPQLIDSIEKLINNTDRYINVAQDWINGFISENAEFESTMAGLLKSTFGSIRNWLTEAIISKVDVLIINISSGVYSVIKAIFDFAIGIIVSVYLLYSKESFLAQIKKLLYSIFKIKTVNTILNGFRLTNKMFGGFLLGKLLSSLIVGIICAIFMLIFGMPYAALVSALIAVTNIIPFIGPFIGAIPSAFLLLLESPGKCLIFIVFIIVLQFFEGNVLSAKIMGNNTGLTGFWVIFAILLGGIFGFIGMIVGVPLFAVFYHLISYISKRRLGRKGLPTETGAYEAVDSITERSE